MSRDGPDPLFCIISACYVLRSDSLRCSDASRCAHADTNYHLVRCIWQILVHAITVSYPLLFAWDHASHSASKESPSKTGANPLRLNKSLMRSLGLAILRPHFALPACI